MGHIKKLANFIARGFAKCFRVENTYNEILRTNELIRPHTINISTADLIVVLITTTLSITSKSITPFYLQRLTARISSNTNTDEWNDKNLFDVTLISFLLMVAAILDTVSTHLIGKMSFQISKDMSKSIVNIQLNEEFQQFLIGSPEDRNSRTNSVHDAFPVYIASLATITQTLTQVFVLSIVIGTRFDQNYAIVTIIAGILLPCGYAAAATNIAGKTNSLEQAIDTQKSELYQVLSESYSPVYYETIFLSGMTSRHIDETIYPLIDRISAAFNEQRNDAFKLNLLRDSLLLLGTTALVISSGYAVTSSNFNFSGTEFELIIQILTLLLPPMRSLSDNIREYLNAMTRMQYNNYYNLLPQAVHSRPTGVTELLSDTDCLFRLSDLVFKVPTLEVSIGSQPQPTLEIRKKQTIALIGESNGGKTCIARLIGGLYRPTEGVVQVAKELIKDGRIDLSKIVVIPQEVAIFKRLSLYQNICYGIQQPAKGMVKGIIDKLGLTNIWEKAEEIERKFFENNDERQKNSMQLLNSLSKGQKQRISLARALLRAEISKRSGDQIKLFILDEPTTALDAENEAHFITTFNALCHELNIAILITAHRLPTIKDVDYIYCIKAGKINEHGDDEQLQSRDQYYKSLLTNSTISFFGYKKGKKDYEYKERSSVITKDKSRTQEPATRSHFSISFNSQE